MTTRKVIKKGLFQTAILAHGKIYIGGYSTGFSVRTSIIVDLYE